MRNKYAKTLEPAVTSSWTINHRLSEHFDHLTDIQDEQISMLVWLASSDVDNKYLLPVMLKMVCGFSNDAVARALMINTQNVQKRLQRAYQKLQQHSFVSFSSDKTFLDEHPNIQTRLHQSLYLLFNEGLNVHHQAKPNNNIMCVEAMNLTQAILTNKQLASEHTLSLFALMNMNLCRLSSRISQDKNGNTKQIPLNLQNRQL